MRWFCETRSRRFKKRSRQLYITQEKTGLALPAALHFSSMATYRKQAADGVAEIFD
jgi:hypothetical protein